MTIFIPWIRLLLFATTVFSIRQEISWFLAALPALLGNNFFGHSGVFNDIIKFREKFNGIHLGFSGEKIAFCK